MRIVILVIASDDHPVYATFKTCWRAYSRQNPNIRVFFLHGMPQENACPDEIRAPIRDSVRPGILQKTIFALEQVEEKETYDFVVRSNLSSFYNLRMLEDVVSTLPAKNCYAGAPCQDGGSVYATGCSFVLSRDVVQRLLTHKSNLDWHDWDDKAIGNLLVRTLHIKLLPLPLYPVQATLDNVDDVLRELETQEKKFHYRIRNDANRQIVDAKIARKLLQIHYGMHL